MILNGGLSRIAMTHLWNQRVGLGVVKSDRGVANSTHVSELRLLTRAAPIRAATTGSGVCEIRAAVHLSSSKKRPNLGELLDLGI